MGDRMMTTRGRCSLGEKGVLLEGGKSAEGPVTRAFQGGVFEGGFPARKKKQ